MKTKRVSKRSPVYGQKVTLILPTLGNRIRGPIQHGPSMRLVEEALERQRIDRLAAEAVKLAGQLAKDDKEKPSE